MFFPALDRYIAGVLFCSAVGILFAMPAAACELSYNFDCAQYGADISGPKLARRGMTATDEVRSVAEKLPVVKGQDGQTIFPAGTTIDKTEIKDNQLSVWVTFPADVKRGTLSEFLTAQANGVMRHFFAESEQLVADRFLARSAGETDYQPIEAFIENDSAAMMARISQVQDNYEPNGPGPQPDPQAAAGRTEVAGPKNSTGQTPTAGSGMPGGALAGRIVFCYGGHGRTWDPTTVTPAWRWQRGFTNNILEDLGNVDACDAYAAYCFNAGATVVPFRPIGYQNNQVVVDNPSAVFSGTWSDSSGGSNGRWYGSGTPAYRFADTANTETATATYTPNIPVAGYYPVYTWVNYGSDRVPGQLYRIRTTGGESQVRVDHRRVGDGWVYLGTYYFYAGSNPATGSVVVSNLNPASVTSGSYVAIADAIRFGNGMGDANNGGGISGYSRREESTVYWIQNGWGNGDTANAASIWNNANTSNDEPQSWNAPGRMAAYMYRIHSDTTATDKRYAIYLGWHSNAGGATARGSEGLITGNPTTNQAWWAAKVSDDVDAAGAQEGSAWEYTWANQASSTYTSSYGEISTTNLGTVMDATIIEVAYHSSVQDAALLRDPKVRNVNGRGAYRATVEYFNNFKAGTLAYLPETPVRLKAVNNGSGGVALSWQAGPTGGTRGEAATSYRVYQSPDGLGWGGGVSSATNSYTVTGLTAGQTYYFRVAGVNAGGESFPTETLAVRVKASGTPKVLIVNGYDRLDRFNNVDRGLSSPADQLILERNNAYNYVRQHAEAIGNYGLSFDSCSNEAVISSDISLTNYDALVWIVGEESTADKTFSATERTMVAAFLNTGGKSLFVSGSEIAFELDGQAVDASFYNNSLEADYAADSGGSHQATGVSGTIFAGLTMNFAVSATPSSAIYDANFPDRLNAINGSVICANYSGGGSGGAAIQFSGGSPARKVVNLGFPFECIGSVSSRNSVMSAAMGFFGITEAVTAVPDWQLY